MLARQQSAICLQAIDFIASARENYSSIAAFIEGLRVDARMHYDRLMARADQESPYYMPWLREHRQVPELDPDKYAHGKDAIAKALELAAPATGTVTHGDSVARSGFGFADNVVAGLMPDLTDAIDAIGKLGEARAALGAFVDDALDAYLRALPPQLITVSRD